MLEPEALNNRRKLSVKRGAHRKPGRSASFPSALCMKTTQFPPQPQTGRWDVKEDKQPQVHVNSVTFFHGTQEKWLLSGSRCPTPKCGLKCACNIWMNLSGSTVPLSHLMTNHTPCSSPGSLGYLQKPSWDHPQNSETVLCCVPQSWCW